MHKAVTQVQVDQALAGNNHLVGHAMQYSTRSSDDRLQVVFIEELNSQFIAKDWLKENSDDEIKPGTEPNQSADGLPVLTAS